MPHHAERPAPVERWSSQWLSLGGDGREDNSPRRLIQSPVRTTALGNEIRQKLADAAPQDRAELARWGVDRCMLALVHEIGVSRAAAHAYRVADVLAGGVR